MDIDTKLTWELYYKYEPRYASLGLYYENPNTAVKYFCTPIGANIFASMGVGGVHFCTIANHGEKIFVVCPEPCSDKYVFPVSNNISEFLHIIISLYGTQLIDQMPMLGKEQFDRMLEQHINSNEQLLFKDIEDLKNKFNIKYHLPDAYDIVMGLYSNFDYSTIKYSSLYFDTLGIEEQ